MKYMLLIYSDETMGADASAEEMQAVLGQYQAYAGEMAQAGVLLAGEGLHPTSAASTVQRRDGKTLSTHGPFAETREQLGGFYMIDCANLDEAMAWAAKCPTADYGSIEVRPIMDYGN